MENGDLSCKPWRHLVLTFLVISMTPQASESCWVHRVVIEGHLCVNLFHLFHADIIAYLTFQNSNYGWLLWDNGLESLTFWCPVKHVRVDFGSTNRSFNWDDGESQSGFNCPNPSLTLSSGCTSLLSLMPFLQKYKTTRSVDPPSISDVTFHFTAASSSDQC